MRQAGAVLLCLVPLVSACNQKPAEKPAEKTADGLTTEDEKTAYAAGVMLGGQLGPLSLNPVELEAVKKGVVDAATGKTPQIDMQTYGPKVRALAQQRMAGKAGGEKEKGKTFAENAAKEQGASTTGTGLVFKTLTPGKGASPAATDVVKVHYKGTLIDGTEFDSSIARGEPAEFPLNRVIACWTEGLQKMKVGEKARLVCPSEIAYGDQGSPPKIPGGSTLVFEVELLEVKKG